MKVNRFICTPLAKAVALGIAMTAAGHAFAQEPDAANKKENDIEKIQVTGSLGSLPGQDVEAVFGFGKSI
ncbi:MAG: hypothetical protein NWQ26_01965, partial [Paraglaciecola sp.]|nr:hypothetical protein [Paraglaciecola sp.]